MDSKNKLRALAAVALACCGLAAHANVTLPGGDVFLTGELDDVKYGTQGNVDGKVTLHEQSHVRYRSNDRVKDGSVLERLYHIEAH